jgi:hypothetical protein
MNILTIKQVFERKMAGLGIEAEITFISQGMLSIFNSSTCFSVSILSNNS